VDECEPLPDGFKHTYTHAGPGGGGRGGGGVGGGGELTCSAVDTAAGVCDRMWRKVSWCRLTLSNPR
jgi:hypothetical protein